jgi:hypothetical protein
MAIACAPTAQVLIARGAGRAAENDWHGARDDYDRAAARKHASEAEHAQALLGAARACERLDDTAGARTRLERAITVEVPGTTELAMFELADLIRTSDRARALNLYYRAAAGAQKRGGAYPYREAMDRILQLSAQSP